MLGFGGLRTVSSVALAIMLAGILTSIPVKPSVAQIQGEIYASSYGVTCDGTTDDTTSMQAAAAAAAGKTVIIPGGVCLIGSVTWPSNALIKGLGGDGSCITTIKRKNFTAGSLFVMGASNSSVQDLCIDGNYAGNSVTFSTNGATAIGNSVLNFPSVNLNVAPGMTVLDLSHTSAFPAGTKVVSKTSTTVTVDMPAVSPGVSSGDSILFVTPPSAELVLSGTINARDTAESVRITSGNWIAVLNNGYASLSKCNLAGTGVALAGADFGVWHANPGADLDVVNCTMTGFKLNAIIADQPLRIVGGLYQGNSTSAAGGQIALGGLSSISGALIVAGGATSTGLEITGPTTISNNIIKGNAGWGIYVENSIYKPDAWVAITGNVIQGNGADGIYVAGNVPGSSPPTPLMNVIITGNKIDSNAGAAVNLNGASDYMVVVGNGCFFNGGGGIANTSSGTHNQIGFNAGC